MQVQQRFEKGADWKIEIGRSSDKKMDYLSIRSRHILPGNRFSPRNSPEVPAREIPELIHALMGSNLVPEELKQKIRLAATCLDLA